MCFPAWFDIHGDDAVVAQPTALRVYAVLLRNPDIHFKPQRTTAWLLADTLHVDPRVASAALKLLIGRGFVLDHDREQHLAEGDRARHVTIPRERQSIRGENAPTRPARHRASA